MKEVIAYKDRKNNYHDTAKKAIAEDIEIISNSIKNILSGNNYGKTSFYGLEYKECKKIIDVVKKEVSILEETIEMLNDNKGGLSISDKKNKKGGLSILGGNK